MGMKFDFGGWATKNNLRCADGLTIRKDAFKGNDGQTVPLVWMHSHDDPENVLGHALLENRNDGVYAYCTFNNTERGQHAKALVEHGDVTALSIYANKLTKNAQDVVHGDIKEVSLVLAGANPGAFIDFATIAHSDGTYSDAEDEATIFSGVEEIELSHADSDEEETKDNEKGEEKVATENKEKTVKDVFDSFTEEQKNVVYFMIGQALEDAGKDGDEAEHSDLGEDEEMKHNVFDTETISAGSVISHDDFARIVKDAKAGGGSLKAAVEDYMDSNSLSHDDLAGDVVFSNGSQQ